jgi:hypothetical protein
MIAGGDGSDTTEYQEDLKYTPADDTYEVKEYSGAEPLLVQKPKTVAVLVQSGTATSVGSNFVTAPAPLFPDALLDRRSPQYSYRNNWQRVTTWSYTMAIMDGSFDIAQQLAAMGRPKVSP